MAGLDGARGAIERLRDGYQRLGEVQTDGESDIVFANQVEEAHGAFGNYLDEDLNISGAPGVLFDLLREANKRIDDGTLTRTDAQSAREFLEDTDHILDVLEPDQSQEVDEERIETLIKERALARSEKNWKRADEIRAEFDAMGVVLEDTPSGTRWKQKV